MSSPLRRPGDLDPDLWDELLDLVLALLDLDLELERALGLLGLDRDLDLDRTLLGEAEVDAVGVEVVEEEVEGVLLLPLVLDSGEDCRSRELPTNAKAWLSNNNDQRPGVPNLFDSSRKLT